MQDFANKTAFVTGVAAALDGVLAGPSQRHVPTSSSAAMAERRKTMPWLKQINSYE
jgi:hypothetical protein